MPSFGARAFSFILGLTGMVRKNFTGGPALEKAIAKARAAGVPMPTAKQRAKLDIREEAFDGQTIVYIAPKGHASPKRLIYFHGGGYIYPISPFHWNFLCHLAEAYGIASIAPLYPLAPENTVARTTEFALAAYKHILESHDAADLAMGGDSAGGGLTAATLHAARDAGLPLPAKALLISPWLNARPDHPDQAEIEKRDVILTRSGIREAGRLYAGDAGPADPRVSPIEGDWSGLPPMLMLGGTNDILVTDSRALMQKLQGIDYDEQPGLPHVWPIFTFKESRAAQARIAGWLKG